MQVVEYLEKLKEQCEDSIIIQNVPMREHTSMRVGGNADLMIEPCSLNCVKGCIEFLDNKQIPFLVMGNGSNLIFSDQGYRGVIIKIGPKLSNIEVFDDIIIAEGGASLAAAANKALEHSLSGLEFASGIPGSIGGAAFMNAGAYDGEMKQVIEETLCIDHQGRFVTLKGSDHEFSYRHSRIQSDGLICVRITLKLQRGSQDEIKAKMSLLNAKRRDKQPLNLPSAGSVFKRPEGYFAGKLIEDCGLKGYSIGGAQVSEKHCGFIVNTGNATASDIVNLIHFVQKSVFEKTGVMLEPEVRIIGGA